MRMFVATMAIPAGVEDADIPWRVREGLAAALELLSDGEILDSLELVPEGEGRACVLVARVEEPLDMNGRC